MKTVRVNLKQNPYSIHILNSDFKKAFSLIQKQLKEDRLFIVTNTKVARLYKNFIINNAGKNLKLNWIVIADGEKHKNLQTVENIHTQLVKKQANRQSTLLALGGGVVGDITGFVAATYMRGISFIQMPTTLLAQVDASVGGKTGVDLSLGKNLVGAFHQPKAVIILTEFLKTLNDLEYKNGLAEVLKHAFILDEKLFNYLQKNSQKIPGKNRIILEHIVYESVKIKTKIVVKDEKEHSLRAILNFGHTLAHAIETIKNYQDIKHGEAVSMGMNYAAVLSFTLGLCKQDVPLKINSLCLDFGLPTKWPDFNVSKYKKAMLADKKMVDKNIRFILIKKIGKTIIVPLNIKDALQCLKQN